MANDNSLAFDTPLGYSEFGADAADVAAYDPAMDFVGELAEVIELRPSEFVTTPRPVITRVKPAREVAQQPAVEEIAQLLAADPARVHPVRTEADWPVDLAEKDRRYLRLRGIGPLVAAGRGYTTVQDPGDLETYSGTRSWSPELITHLRAAKSTVLVLPLFSALDRKGPACHQLRPAVPRVKDEKPLKFELPYGLERGAGSDELPVGDVHPDVEEDGETPLLITEGVAKGDAVLTACLTEGVDLIPVSVTGVTMAYESANTSPTGRRRLSPALTDAFELQDRLVLLAWDADWATNRNVGGSLVKTGRLLERAGATVRIVDTPALADPDTGREDRKAGIDDLLASGQRLAGVLRDRLLTVDAAARRVREYELTDDGRGQRLAAEMAATGSHRVITTRKKNPWLQFGGTHWLPSGGSEMALSARLARGVPADQQGRSARAISAAVILAATDPRVQTSDGGLDPDGWLLNTRSGTVDLLRAELRPHDPADLITSCTPTGFDPADLELHDFGAPTWARFLDATFGGDQELIAWVQRWAGMAAIGVVREDLLIQAQGVTGGGKSTFFGALTRTLGDGYARVLPPKMLMGDGASDEEMAALTGARLVVLSETQPGDRLHGSTLKQVAGREPISARHLYGDRFTFTPSHSAVLVTNHRPTVSGDDGAIWRRMLLLPFRHAVREGARDPDLDAKLDAERQGILAWMVAGGLAYVAAGRLGTCPAVEEASAAYRTEQDLIGRFIAERLELRPGLRTQRSRLYPVFQMWCVDEGRKPWTKSAFLQALEERGVGLAAVKSSGTFFHDGVGLVDDDRGY